MSSRITWRIPVFSAALLGVLTSACSVDHRKLHRGSAPGASSGGNAGEPLGNTGNLPDAGAAPGSPVGGSPGSEPDSGSGGEAPTPSHLPPLVDGCADLDTDHVADCTVTLVENASFGTDVSGWSELGDSDLAWDTPNALADQPSGCARLTATGSTDIDGSVLFRAAQCVAVPAGQLVIAYANVLVEPSEGDAEPARGQLEVSYFDSQDCSGKASGYFTTPPSESTGTWETIQAGGVTGSATTSVLVELVGVKPYRAANLSACFDNVMLKAKDL